MTMSTTARTSVTERDERPAHAGSWCAFAGISQVKNQYPPEALA